MHLIAGASAAATPVHRRCGATFGWEQLPGAEHVVELREQLGREEELSAAYREGPSLPFARVAGLAVTLLGEIA